VEREKLLAWLQVPHHFVCSSLGACDFADSDDEIPNSRGNSSESTRAPCKSKVLAGGDTLSRARPQGKGPPALSCKTSDI